jgi:hypothetical protein
MRSLLSTTLGALVIVASAAVAQAQDQPPPVVIQQQTPPPAPVVVQQPAPAIVEAPAPAPVAVTESSSLRTDLIATGLISFGISYGAAVVVAGTSDRTADHRLYVPVVGPWLDLADRGTCDIDKSSCDSETTNKVLLVLDGIFQGAGVISTVAGVLTPVEHETYVSSRKVHVTPVSFGRGAPGLAAFGRF